MPVSFLTDEQQRRYGRYVGELTADQLAHYFHLDDADHELIMARRGDHNRLGFALQLGTVRYLGTFLENPIETPPGVVAYVARQLGIADSACFAQYCAGEQRWEHAAEIRHRYGYRDFSSGAVLWRLNRWLYALCWSGTDRPSLLFDRATTWLIMQKVLLPGVSVLERLVARVRTRVQERLWRVLVRGLSPESQARLDTLLKVPEGQRRSALDRLRTGPTLRSAPELVRALRRLEEVRTLGLGVSVSARVPRGRVLELARFAATAKVSALERLALERRMATLVAFVHTLEATAQDDALDLLDVLLTEIFSKAEELGRKARLRTLKDLDAAALQTSAACGVLLDPSVPDAQVRAVAFAGIPRHELEAARQQIARLVRPPEDVSYQELQTQYRRVRRFLPTLLRSMPFRASPAGEPVLEALQYLRMREETGPRGLPQPPLTVVNKAWRHYVVPNGAVDPKAYTFCVLERHHHTLRRRDLFVAPSVRYADPRIGLLEGEGWANTRPFICRTLGLPPTPHEALAALRQQLDHTYRAVAANLPHNDAVRIEQTDGKEELTVSALDKLDEPPTLVALREAVKARLPRVDLPEILLEIAARTGFTEEFTHISEREARAADLATSLCAVLMAEACNIGLSPLVRSDVPALRWSRLVWVSQHYFRNETLTEANARLVAAQNQMSVQEMS